MDQIDPKMIEMMDAIEDALVGNTILIVESAGHKITKKQARALLGNIGNRIAYGKEIMDPIIFKEKKGE